MADFDLSARITADASGLVKAGDEGERALREVGKAAADASTGTDKLERSTESLAAASTKAAAGSRTVVAAQTEMMRATKVSTDATLSQVLAQQRAERSAIQTAAAEARLATAENQQERSAAAAALAAIKLEQAQSRLSQGARAATGNINAQGYAVRNVGQQFGDFGLQVAGGADVARAFGQQAGQLGFALSELRSGPLSKLGAFLVGPWGIAFTIAAAFVAPLVEELFKAKEAAKAVELGSTGLGSAQGALGEIFDLTTGKIKKQNAELAASADLLRLNARLAAINLRTEAANEALSSRKTFEQAGRVSTGDRAAAVGLGFTTGGVGGAIAAVAGGDQARRNARNLEIIAEGIRTGRITSEDGLRAANKQDFTGTNTNREQFIAAIRDNLSSRAKVEIADLTDKSLNSGTLSSGLRNSARPKAPPKPKSTVARDEFGRDTEDRLAGIRDSLSDVPERVASVNKQIRQLDDLIDDLNRKKPPGFEKLIADAKALKPLVQDSLQRPYEDFVRQQQEALDVQRLLTAGRVDEANALKTVQGLQRTMGPLTDEQKAAILATNVALRAEGRALDDLRAKNAKYLEALGSIKGIVEDATQAFVRGDLGQIIKSPKKLLDAFQTLQGRALFDRVFGGLFQELEDQVNGTSVVRDASARMATAVDKASASILRLGNAAASAAAGVAGGQSVGAAVAGAGGAATDENGDIVVTARRRDPSFDPFAASIDKVFSKLGIKDPQFFGKSIGQNAGKAFQGAATGSLVAGVSKAIGVKLNSTGAQLGGAAGSFLPIPGGQVIGSIVGGLIGNLFGKAKSASAGLNISGGSVSAGTATGTASRQAGASTLAGAVADGVAAIAQQLGAQITGSSNVKIGTYKDQLRVSTNGTPIGGKGSSGAITFKSEAEAISYAIRDAINDGVFSGLSNAVVSALNSNSDVDKAVAEALKVQEVERLIGGLGGALKSQFEAFDKTAADRLRIARQYGLDVLAIEKLNAEQRTALVDDTLKARIGSLSDFLNSIKFGDLFEGSASDRRKALQDEIAKVQKDAEAGKDGAADRLAALYQQLVSTSKEAFGTAGGEFTGDRSAAITAVERVIQMERDRVNAASGGALGTTAAVQQVAALQNETNDLLARIAAGVEAGGGSLPPAYGYTNDFSPITQRKINLAA